MLSLKRAMALGAMRRLGSRSLVKLTPSNLLCLLGVFQLADFFHQSFSSGQAFRLALRPKRFDPFRGGLRSITPTFRQKRQHLLFGPVFLPPSAHESRRLLALPFIPLAGYRSGLRSLFPARPSCCSAFRHWSASISSPTA